MKQTTVFEEIAKAEAERSKTLSDLNANLEKEKSHKAAAEAKAQEAISRGNAEAYTAAKEAERKSSDKIEFYILQIKKIGSDPLFDNPADRKAKGDEIRTQVAEMKQEKLKEAARLLKQADERVREAHAEILKGNNAINTLTVNAEAQQNIDFMMLNGLIQRMNAVKQHIEMKAIIDKL